MNATSRERGARRLLVPTTGGMVQGVARDGVSRWRSIPYGRPTWGPLRLRAPEPAQPWRGVRHCGEFTFCAPQDPRFTLTGLTTRQAMSEDCLSVNVVAPTRAVDTPLPVLFFVHGGGYAFGSTATPLYDGAALARRGCVYVSSNYRLGALGCLDLSSLSTPQHPIQSNVFLRDLVLALGWVKDNIAWFGGDPDNVTIFGESAGGHAVATLLATPQARGLFHRAIAQSPPAGMVHSAQTAAKIADWFAEELGACHRDAAAVIRAAPPARLVQGLERVMRKALATMPGSFGLGATIDGDVLPADPIEAMAAGAAHQVPLIIGHNADEARLFAWFMDELPTNPAAIERLLHRVDPAARQRFSDAYPRYPDRSTCVRIGGDVVFGSTAWRIAEAHGRHMPTYLYRYGYAPRTLAWSGLGATHATELLALFDIYRGALGSILTVAGDRSSALRVSRDVQHRWHSFSQNGDPGNDWPAYRAPQRSVMVFDRRTRVENDPAPKRREVWSNFNLAQ